MNPIRFVRLAVVLALVAAGAAVPSAQQRLLNVSYDPTRELYKEFNSAFVRHWEAKTKQKLTVQQSHGGAGSQARAVIDGLDVRGHGIQIEHGGFSAFLRSGYFARSLRSTAKRGRHGTQTLTISDGPVSRHFAKTRIGEMPRSMKSRIASAQ
jgi:hypothetical protein